MKRVLSQFIIHLVHYIAAIWIGILAAFIAPLICNLFVSKPTPTGTGIISGIALTAGTLVWLFILSKRMGYEERELRLAHELPAVGAVFALQAVLASPMGFVPYITGPVSYFAQAIHFGDQDLELLENTSLPLFLCVWLLIAFDLLCMTAIFTGQRIGMIKRQKDRNKTITQSVKQDIPVVPIYQGGERTTLSSDPPEQAPISNAALRLDALEVREQVLHTDTAVAEEPSSPVDAKQTEHSPSPHQAPPTRQSAMPRKRPAPSPRPQIPPECVDLRRMVNRRLIPAKVVAILSGIAFVAMEGYSLWRFHDTPSRMFGASILFGLVCMAPTAAFKVGDRLSDRSFEGQVLDMEYRTKTKIGLDRRAHYYTVAKMRIREDSGKEFNYDYLVKGTTPFGVGSRIRHYACTDFMYLLDEGSPIVCVNCGNHYSATPEVHSDEDARYGFDHLEPGAHIPDRCGYCGKSMIKRPMKKEE